MNQGAGSYWGVDDFQVEGLIYQTSVPMCLLGPANSGSRVLTPHLRVSVLYAGVLIDGITVLPFKNVANFTLFIQSSVVTIANTGVQKQGPF